MEWLVERGARDGGRTIVLGCLLLAGCGAPPATGADCTGAARSLADCFIGDYYAECGGSGPPRFGCMPDASQCMWFTGGCAPDGFVLSSCDASDVCCLPGATEPGGSTTRWPFALDAVTGRGWSVSE